MNRFGYRTGLRAGLLAIALTAGASAQESTLDNGAATACGTHRMEQLDYDLLLRNTARENPALFARMTAAMKEGTLNRPRLQADEIEWTFYVAVQGTSQFEEVQGVLKYDGPHSRVWIDVADTGRSNLKLSSPT